MKKIKCEKLKVDWLNLEYPSKDIFEKALLRCIDVVRSNLDVYRETFLDSSGINNSYPKRNNSPWTTGFCTGMIWMAYDITKDEAFKEVGQIHTGFFRERLDTRYVIDHHDIGFLYSLSSVADYKLTGNLDAKVLSVDAADHLMTMFRKKPGIIQRGGNMNDPEHKFTGIFIIDCLMNVPLLYWASVETGNPKYREAAYRHTIASIEALFLETGNTVQKGKGDIYSGEYTNFPYESQGEQGPEACWSRGQAWAMYGLPLSYAYTKDEYLLEVAKCVTNYYLNRLPNDYIANWDLLYEGDNDQRDTSAAAIAASALLEHASHLPVIDSYRKTLELAAMKMLESLIENYMIASEENSNAILASGTYAYNGGRGVNEPCIWGDYYFVEALWRLTKLYKSFW